MQLSKIKTVFLALSVTIMAGSMIAMPEESFEASVRGLNMWWEIVFPSLFPFFVISELLIGFGVVTFMGVLLEPLMRPLFRVPGVGGFAWAMGMASGFPAGAKLSARLRQEGHLTRIEAERLASFTNSSSPLFIFGAVSVGFFFNPKLGILLAIAHYLGNFCVGLIMRFHGGKSEVIIPPDPGNKFPIRDALVSLHRTRLRDRRPLGKLLGDAVISSIHTLLMIGGFIILFSVINKLLFHLHITAFLAEITGSFISALHFPQELNFPLIAGLFEITLGSQMTSQAESATLLQQSVMTSFILGFSGFSVQAQVASILAQTDIRFRPFFIARILHGFLAALFTWLLWKPVYEQFYNEQSPAAIPVAFPGLEVYSQEFLHWFIRLGPLFTLTALFIYLLIWFRRSRKSSL